MPLESWHRSKNAHNLIVSSYLRTRNPDYVDWEVTTIFYAAMQLVDAFIAKKDPSNLPTSHEKRNKWVMNNLQKAYGTYMKLLALSKASRYTSDMTENDRMDAMKWYHALEPMLH